MLPAKPNNNALCSLHLLIVNLALVVVACVWSNASNNRPSNGQTHSGNTSQAHLEGPLFRISATKSQQSQMAALEFAIIIIIIIELFIGPKLIV